MSEEKISAIFSQCYSCTYKAYMHCMEISNKWENVPFGPEREEYTIKFLMANPEFLQCSNYKEPVRCGTGNQENGT